MEYRVIKGKSREEKGSITLEASIFLVLFIVFYMMMMGLIQIVRAQVILQYAANETAREISQYSYVLTKTGIVEKRVSTSSQAAAFTENASQLMDDIEKVGNTLSTGEGLEELPGNIEQAGQHAESLLGDPDALMNNIFSLIKTKGADLLSSMWRALCRNR